MGSFLHSRNSALQWPFLIERLTASTDDGDIVLAVLEKAASDADEWTRVLEEHRLDLPPRQTAKFRVLLQQEPPIAHETRQIL